MGRRILVLQGHPDASQVHLGHALGDAYARGANAAGHEVRRIDLATLDFPLLRSQREWKQGSLPPGLADAQVAINWAQHIVFFFPLWLGDMPALLRGFLEQVTRPGFAFPPAGKAPLASKGLSGRSARVVVTMGMPATVYRWYFRGRSLTSLERNILGTVGIAPVSRSLIGMAGNMAPEAAGKWLSRLEKLGRQGA